MIEMGHVEHFALVDYLHYVRENSTNMPFSEHAHVEHSSKISNSRCFAKWNVIVSRNIIIHKYNT